MQKHTRITAALIVLHAASSATYGQIAESGINRPTKPDRPLATSPHAMNPIPGSKSSDPERTDRIRTNPNGTPQVVSYKGPLKPEEVQFHPKAPVQLGPLRPAPSAPSRLTLNADGSIQAVGTSRQPLGGLTDLMWVPGTTLKVKLMGSTAKVRSKIREFAEIWTKYANIKFDWVDSGPAEIKVSFNRGGSWSVIGKEALGVPFDFATMNFGWFDDSTPDVELRRVTLHEFGHALGFIHEHQSPAAGIPWDREQVYRTCANESPPWDKATCDKNYFDQYKANTTNYSTFDPRSIMLYAFPAQLTLNGIGTPSNTDLSQTDKLYASRWYPFPRMQAGMLRTGDDCDEIDFKVEPGKAPKGMVQFDFMLAMPLTWYKGIKVPVGGSGDIELSTQDATRSRTIALPSSALDRSRQMRFVKAKEFGARTTLGYTWDVMPVLNDGDALSLTWKRDSCR